MPATDDQQPVPDPVQTQYERWVYPEPVDDLTDPSNAEYLRSFQTLKALSRAYWPAGQPRQDLDVLVAGCGTMSAACYAHVYPQCRVTGIDISRSSLAHEQRLRDRHKLTNLTIRHCPIEQIAGLGQTFDFIDCRGVLHHMADPTGGLRALAGVLRRDGVIAIMLYGTHGWARIQIQAFQDLFRLAGLDQNEQDLAVVRQTLSALPLEHPFRPYIRDARYLKSDAGIVDSFLHRRDRSYSVPECVALTKQAGLVFQGWEQNSLYYPDALLAGAPMLRERLARLPDEQIWHAMELAMQWLTEHWFYVCRADRDPATYVIPWDSQRLLECIPLRLGTARLMQRGADGQWAMGDPSRPVPLTAPQAAIFSRIDGARTVRQCLSAAGISGDPQTLLHVAREFFRLLWRSGLGLLRIVPAV